MVSDGDQKKKVSKKRDTSARNQCAYRDPLETNQRYAHHEVCIIV